MYEVARSLTRARHAESLRLRICLRGGVPENKSIYTRTHTPHTQITESLRQRVCPRGSAPQRALVRRSN